MCNDRIAFDRDSGWQLLKPLIYKENIMSRISQVKKFIVPLKAARQLIKAASRVKKQTLFYICLHLFWQQKFLCV